MFDEAPTHLAPNAFDFFTVEDIADCQTIHQHVPSGNDDGSEQGENKGFLRGFTRLFAGQEDSQPETPMANLPKVTAMCVVNPLAASQTMMS